MFLATGCDAVMVARGARGNPFIFAQILHYLRTGEDLDKPSAANRVKTLLKQARLSAQEKGEYLAMRQIRKHAAWYLKGIRNAAHIRSEAVKICTLNDLEQLLSLIIDDSGA